MSGPSAAVILSESRVDDERAGFLADSGTPFACFGRLAPDLPQHWVDVDNVAGMRAVVDIGESAGEVLVGEPLETHGP